MVTKENIYADLQQLVNKAFSYAGSVELGEERIAAFALAESLRRLQRVNGPQIMLAATNPFTFSDEDEEDWDEE